MHIIYCNACSIHNNILYQCRCFLVFCSLVLLQNKTEEGLEPASVASNGFQTRNINVVFSITNCRQIKYDFLMLVLVLWFVDVVTSKYSHARKIDTLGYAYYLLKKYLL